jgi:hypothetical protein
MRNLSIIATAVLAVAAPVAASAQTTAPVTINSYFVQPQLPSASDTIPLPGLVAVSFTNHRNVAATEVDFAVEAGGSVVDQLTDVGTFSKDVAIRHTLQTTSVFGNSQIVVASVTFADGTTWTNDAAPRALPQAVSLNF